MNQSQAIVQGTLYGHWIEHQDAKKSDVKSASTTFTLQDLRDRFRLLSGGRSFEEPLEEHEILYVPIHNTESSTRLNVIVVNLNE